MAEVLPPGDQHFLDQRARLRPKPIPAFLFPRWCVVKSDRLLALGGFRFLGFYGQQRAMCCNTALSVWVTSGWAFILKFWFGGC
jgi:hypothetical protein